FKQKLSELSSAIAEHAPAPVRPDGIAATAEALRPGLQVFVTSLGQLGEVAGPIERGRVPVQIGAMRTTVAPGDLVIKRGQKQPDATRKGKAPSRTEGRRARRSQSATATATATATAPTASRDDTELAVIRTPDITVDVRGERADEAVDSVDRFIDKSLMAMRDLVFVIHGHGTGALRSAIRGHLETHHAVTGWRPGQRSEGGNGVTIAWLASD
ncbi:MAG: Smr/MutS family protein, partial [Myxococcota bacterium]